MARPVIGITMDSGENARRYGLSCDYATSVERAGGIPFPIPYKTSHSLIPEIVEVLDGVLFTGGDDLDPGLYGQAPNPNAIRIDVDRQNFELALMAQVEKMRTPTLGVCLGSQLMNVFRGGSLHQFLPELERPNAIEHRRLDRELPRHVVNVDTQTLLGRVIGKTQINANTYHKQAVKEIGRGLRVVATAPDGVIEGLEDPTFPLFAAVQWHPERLSDEADHLALFKLLVEKSMAAAMMR